MNWIDVIVIAVGGCLALVLVHEIRVYEVARIRSQAVAYRKEQSKNQVSDFFTGLTVARNQLVKLRDDQKAKGVTPEQLKGMERQLYLMDLALNNQMWIEIAWPVAQPFLKKVIKSGVGLLE